MRVSAYKRQSMRNRFLNNDSGSVIVIFGIAVFALVGVVGAAVDYSIAAAKRTTLDAKADASTLAAVSVFADPFARDAADRAKANMRMSFEAAAETLPALVPGSLVAQYEYNSNDGVARLCYEARVRAHFVAIFGDVSVANCVAAQAVPPVYINLHFLIDASGSMGIGASSTDQALMQRKLGCLFACHTIDWTTPVNTPNCESPTTTCVRRIGARTRFDVARYALARIVDEAATIPPERARYAFSVHKFSNYVTRVHPLSSDPRSVSAVLKRLEMDVRGTGTNVGLALDEIARSLPRSGDGRTPQTAINHVFLVTDGLENNVFMYCTGDPCLYHGSWRPDPDLRITTPGFYEGTMRNQVVDPAACDVVKSTGALLSVLNLEYVVPRDTPPDWHMGRIANLLVPNIPPAMQACASNPSSAFVANDPVEIERALEAMFRQTMEQARLIE